MLSQHRIWGVLSGARFVGRPKSFGALRSQKQDKGRCSPEARSRGALLPFKADVGSGAPAFAPLFLRTDDKAAAARVGVPDLSSLLSSPATMPSADAGAEESRRQVVGFAQAAARAAAMAPSAPALGLQSQQQQQQQQQARKARRCWSTELHRKFVAALDQLGGPQGEPCLVLRMPVHQNFLPVLGHQHTRPILPSC
jgi:hypothetical protein